jgi:hypothetical protein
MSPDCMLRARVPAAVLQCMLTTMLGDRCGSQE